MQEGLWRLIGWSGRMSHTRSCCMPFDIGMRDVCPSLLHFLTRPRAATVSSTFRTSLHNLHHSYMFSPLTNLTVTAQWKSNQQSQWVT